MVKTLKEYLSTVTIGGLGLIKPMSSLSRKGTDIEPKNGSSWCKHFSSTLPKEKKKEKTK